MPINTLGRPWCIERDREPGLFWIVIIAHGLMFGLATVAVVLGDWSA